MVHTETRSFGSRPGTVTRLQATYQFCVDKQIDGKTIFKQVVDFTVFVPGVYSGCKWRRARDDCLAAREVRLLVLHWQWHGGPHRVCGRSQAPYPSHYGAGRKEVGLNLLLLTIYFY